jgi:hypothetical protein
MNERMIQRRADTFWAKVDQAAGPDGCWPYRGWCTPTGYGRHERILGERRAHRIAFALTFGDVGRDVALCHRCDNRSCCNPRHLFAGDHVTNMRDMVVKGRSAVGARHVSVTSPERLARGARHGMQLHPESRCLGEKNGQSRLTRDDAIAIKARRLAGEKLHVLAAEFGVTETVVSRIARGKAWSWIEVGGGK